MDEAERQFFRTGLAQGLVDVVERTPDGANAVRRLIGNRVQRDRLRAAFDDEGQFNEFLLTLQNEAAMFQSRAAVLGNSVTGRLQAEQADLLDEAGGTLANVALGRFNEVRDSAVRNLFNRIVSGPRNASLSSELADILTAQGPAARGTLLRLTQTPPAIPPALERPALTAILAGSAQGANR